MPLKSVAVTFSSVLSVPFASISGGLAFAPVITGGVVSRTVMFTWSLAVFPEVSFAKMV